MITQELLQEYERAKKENHLWWLKTLFRNKSALIQICIIALVFLAGIFAFLAPYGYEEDNLKIAYEGSSWAHFFGADGNGRDLFSRILFSMRTVVLIAGAVLLFGGFLITLSLGLISGYYAGSKKEWIIMRIGEFFAMLPGFFMLIFIVSTVKPRYHDLFYSWGSLGGWLMKEGIVDFSLVILVFSLFFWVEGARVIRSQTLMLRETLFIDAARAMGASDIRIILRHILSNLSHILILSFSSLIVAAVGIEIGLSFLNLGITPPHPSFGLMFSDVARTGILEKHAHLLIFPGLIVTVLLFSVKRLADNLIRITEART